MEFDGSGATSYMSTNNLGASYGVNQIRFNNAGTGVATVAGSTLNPIGTGPMVLQNGAGGAAIATGLVLTTGTTFGGTGTGELTIASALSGGGTITKSGTGTLVIAADSPSYSGAMNLNAGTVRVDGAGGELDKALGNGLVTVNAATLELDNVTMGTADNVGPNLLLRDGASLVDVGVSSIHFPSVDNTVGAPRIANGSSGSPVSVNMEAVGVNDVLTISTAIRGNSKSTSYATINVSGQGRIALTAGGLNSATTYGGSWTLQSGILQMGGDTGEGEALNALGFKDGDAKEGNTISVYGGTLAGGVNVPVTVTSTPDFFRANVIMAGGAISSTNGVDAEYGGGFTTAVGTTSYVDVFDPVSPGVARDVDLVAGAAGDFNNPSAVTLGGTLVVTPGLLASGGALNIERDGGTVSVVPGAGIVVRAGATVNVSGLNVMASSTTGVSLAVSGRFNLLPGVLGTSRLASLVVTGVGVMDVGDNPVVLDYSGTSPVDTVRQYLLSGRNSGAWNGVGISSSSAAGDAMHRTGIGYAEATALGITSFKGQAVDTTSIVMEYTYYGDANLDGKVNADDYALVDRGMAKHLTGWVNGDFNYDGVVNAADYLLMDRGYALQGGALTPGMLAEREEEFGEGYVEELVASVPEPGMGVLVVGVGLMGRRRRLGAAAGEEGDR
jgi:autotransporter-associated beta strand protein